MHAPLHHAGIVAALLLAGCYGPAASDVPVASAPLVRADGSVAGAVQVVQGPTGLTLRVDARGLPPGRHGVHLHALGRCDPPGFTSAGGHWNPDARQHGHNNPAGAHRGDLGNVGIGPDGRLIVGLLVPGTSYRSASLSAPTVLADADGAALVIHADADDERTDPSGNSGARIACAVIAAPAG